jgi:uncharacterized protein
LEGVFLKVFVIPNSSKNEIIYRADDFLKVRLKAVPDKGKANESLIKFLKKELGIKARIVKGLRSKEKVLEIL